MKKQISETNLIYRLLLSFIILIFIRIGSFLPIPEIDTGLLNFYLEQHSITKRLFNMFSGNDTVVIGIFTLNIFPYINASIILQILTNIIPNLSKLKKEGGGETIRTFNKLTRIITFVIALLQSSSIAIFLKSALFNWDFYLALDIIIWLTTGAMIVLWLSEIITEYGLGNGPSLLIYTNIVSNLPNFFKTLINNNLTVFSWIIVCICFFICLYGIVLLQEAIRKIPLISSKQLNQPFFSEETISKFESNYNYIPLKYNQSGVMPIILATAVLIIPNYLYNAGIFSFFSLEEIFPFFNFSSKIIYWSAYFSLIIIFSLFYSTIILNPEDISNELQKMAVSIPGIRPGIETSFYLKKVMSRITIIGSIILAILTIFPTIIGTIFTISDLTNFGTTSLLILVGVILDLTREIRSIILSNIYNDMFN